MGCVAGFAGCHQTAVAAETVVAVDAPPELVLAGLTVVVAPSSAASFAAASGGSCLISTAYVRNKLLTAVLMVLS